MTTAIILGVLLLLAAGGFAIGLKYRKAPAAWDAATEPFGLVKRPGQKLYYSGTVGRYPVEVQIVGRGAGDNYRTYTQVRVDAGLSSAVYFDTSRDADLFAHLEAALTEQIEVGDPAFDEQVRVYGDRLVAQRMLTPRVCETILARKEEVRIRLEDGDVYTEKASLVREPEPLRRQIEIALEAAELLR